MVAFEVQKAAFEAASGVSFAHLSLFIRGSIGVVFLLWAAWIVYGHVQRVQHDQSDAEEFVFSLLRLLLLCSLMVILISLPVFLS